MKISCDLKKHRRTFTRIFGTKWTLLVSSKPLKGYKALKRSHLYVIQPFSGSNAKTVLVRPLGDLE